MPPLLLASESPRRKQYLLEMGFDFRVVRSVADEKRLENEEPDTYVRRVARLKATGASGAAVGAVVLAADTAVFVDGELLEKPKDQADFERMMKLLSGRTHEVRSGVAVRVIGGETTDATSITKVTFRELSPEMIAWYWATNEPKDKAGGYAAQGRAAAFITGIEGQFSTVVGLPLIETLALLDKAGVRPPWLDPRVRI